MTIKRLSKEHEPILGDLWDYCFGGGERTSDEDWNAEDREFLKSYQENDPMHSSIIDSIEGRSKYIDEDKLRLADLKESNIIHLIKQLGLKR